MGMSSAVSVGMSLADSQVITIPVERIRRLEGQPRKYFNKVKLEELAGSIKTAGLKKPVYVTRVKNHPYYDYQLVDGERRWLAHKIAGLAYMLAIVLESASDDDQFLDSVLHNAPQEPHTALEYTDAIERIMQMPKLADLNIGEKVTLIAKFFGNSESWVNYHRSMLRLNPRVRMMMAPEIPEERRLGDSIAQFISGLHPDLQEKIATHVVDRRMTLHQARFYAREVAEGDGQVAGHIQEGRGPRHDFRILKNFSRRVYTDLTILLSAPVLTSLRKRGEKDMSAAALEIDQCIAKLVQLREELGGGITDPQSITKVVLPDKPVVDQLVETTLPIKETSPVPTSDFPVPIPKPICPEEVSRPIPSSRKNQDKKKTERKEVVVFTSNIPDDQFEMHGKILVAMLYSENSAKPRVNLSREYLKKQITKITGSDSSPVDEVVKAALSVARGSFRLEIGKDMSAAQQKFVRFMYRIRRDFGGSHNFDNTLSRIRQEGSGPVNRVVLW